jgi:hypothetical protein
MHDERKVVREMLVMVRATLQDGKVHEEEAESLQVWLKYHPDMVVTGLGKEIAEKLVAVFEDGRITQRERKELLVLLQELMGQDPE